MNGEVDGKNLDAGIDRYMGRWMGVDTWVDGCRAWING